MRVSTQFQKTAKSAGFKPRALTYQQRVNEVRQRMMRWQQVGANRGTQQVGKLAVDDFTYSTEIFTIGEGQRVTKLIEVETDAFFDIISRQIFLSGAMGLNMDVDMFDSASDRMLLQPTPVKSFAGTGGLPHGSIQIRTLSPTQRLRVNFSRGVDGIGAIVCQLSLTGRKVFIGDY